MLSRQFDCPGSDYKNWKPLIFNDAMNITYYSDKWARARLYTCEHKSHNVCLYSAVRIVLDNFLVVTSIHVGPRPWRGTLPLEYVIFISLFVLDGNLSQPPKNACLFLHSWTRPLLAGNLFVLMAESNNPYKNSGYHAKRK